MRWERSGLYQILMNCVLLALSMSYGEALGQSAQAVALADKVVSVKPAPAEMRSTRHPQGRPHFRR